MAAGFSGGTQDRLKLVTQYAGKRQKPASYNLERAARGKAGENDGDTEMQLVPT